MRVATPALHASIVAALVLAAPAAAPAAAQQGAGEGFLFRAPTMYVTFYGGLALPMAAGGVHALAMRELTVDRSDFRSGSFGFDLAIPIRPRLDVIVGMERSRAQKASEYREWVDNNDQPIEQVTRFSRMPLMVSGRYYFADRGRQVGSIAWIPAHFVPFVTAGIGAVQFDFEQNGDFVDEETLDVFSARLRSRDWAPAAQGGAGMQWSISPRTLITGELRYLAASGDGDSPSRDFAGYRVDLSGVSTMIGLTLRF